MQKRAMNSVGIRVRILLALVMPFALGEAAASAQQSDAGGAKQEKVAAIKQSLAKNQAALKQYTWTETTQISLKGEVKKEQQKLCQYGPDGKVQKTDIGPAAPSQPQQQENGGRGRRGGALKKAIIQKKVGETKDYMERVTALVHEYVPPDPEKIQAAAAAGNISVTPTPSISAITIKNYLKSGDSIALGFDGAAKKIVSYDVDSYLDKPKDDAVQLAVKFASLPDGTNYAQQTVLNAPGKKIQVTTTNSGYKKAGT
jgi:hypothetical protein